MSEYGQIERARSEDAEFFQRWPDREYRLRGAWNCEHVGVAPLGYAVFAIVYRRDALSPVQFGAPLTFETDRTDSEVREILAAVLADPFAMQTKANL